MKKKFWEGEKVLITGGRGFLGTRLISELEKLTKEIFSFSSQEYDLRKKEQVEDLFRATKPSIVIHLATDLGNLQYLKEHAGEVFYNNLMMNTLVLDCSRKQKVRKFVGIGTAFSYPKDTPVPFKEENLWNGVVEEDSASYSLSKKMVLVQSQNYRKQFGLNAINLIITSLYGPAAKNSSAIPSMIKKFDKAVKNKKERVEFWGTGNATRDLLYVKDAADAIILATEAYDKESPINVGSGKEIKIKTLVDKLGELMNFSGEIFWDPTKPEGPKKVFLDSSKAKKEFDFEAKTSLEKGLKETINYFQSLEDLNS